MNIGRHEPELFHIMSLIRVRIGGWKSSIKIVWFFGHFFSHIFARKHIQKLINFQRSFIWYQAEGARPLNKRPRRVENILKKTNRDENGKELLSSCWTTSHNLSLDIKEKGLTFLNKEPKRVQRIDGYLLYCYYFVTILICRGENVHKQHTP